MSSASLAVDQAVASGPGWHADIYLMHIILRVGPQGHLEDAVATLVAPSQLRFWTLEWIYEDEFGQDVFLFKREH